ncbi:MAG: hypothetical protein CBC35_03140 [Planctomycetes bacterium TMED75]|nr:deoxyribodipyrimidine photolyase [Planctomycetaceae bacterium]OUU94895.1 MAG: hypothetical protein CBC35_03140 [Planctomycetes bacterium TMED75]
MTSIIWFRDDLRLSDHRALDAALAAAPTNTRAIFLITPRTWLHHGWGAPRVAYLLKSLSALHSELYDRGITLEVRNIESYEQAPACLSEMALEYNCTEVHAGIEYGVNEQRRDLNVRQALELLGCSLILHHTQTAVPVDQITTATGTPYKVFTPFKAAWDKLWASSARPEPTTPELIPNSTTSVQSSVVPKTIDGFAAWPQLEQWEAGTNAGIRRLEQFIECDVEHYHTNRDRPDLTGTSTLSPWLAVGSISTTMCLDLLIEQYGPSFDDWPKGPLTWKNELVWREFYRHVMNAFPDVSKSRPMKAWTDHVPWREDSEELTRWKQGQTGIEIVDAAMNQLSQTGWMHNRTRMIVAMFLTKNLLVNWRHGERHFSTHLVDYDFASNNGGWQWAASTGTDAAPYFRIFNPDTQALRFDPDGSYRRRWLAETAALSPEPIVDLKESRKQAIEIFKQAQSNADS